MANVSTSSYIAGNIGGEPGVNAGSVEVWAGSRLLGTADSGAVTITPDGIHVLLHDGRQVFATNSGLVLVDVLPEDDPQ